MSSVERKEKILNLFAMYPRTFSIKEITDFYSSLEIHINRNSLRKTLDEMVRNGEIKSTRPTQNKRGRRYSLGSLTDIYTNLSTLVTAEKTLFNLGRDLTKITSKKLRNYEGYDLFGVLKDNIRVIKLSYPFLYMDFDKEGNFIPATSITTHPIDDNSSVIRVSPCLCRGLEKYRHACSMVVGSLETIASWLIDPSISVKWVRSGVDANSYCNFAIEVRGDIARKYQQPDVNLDDPAERERIIPGL